MAARRAERAFLFVRVLLTRNSALYVWRAFFEIGDLDALGILRRADYSRPKFVHMNSS